MCTTPKTENKTPIKVIDKDAIVSNLITDTNVTDTIQELAILLKYYNVMCIFDKPDTFNNDTGLFNPVKGYFEYRNMQQVIINLLGKPIILKNKDLKHLKTYFLKVKKSLIKRYNEDILNDNHPIIWEFVNNELSLQSNIRANYIIKGVN